MSLYGSSKKSGKKVLRSYCFGKHKDAGRKASAKGKGKRNLKRAA